jgi:hypothetical protein
MAVRVRVRPPAAPDAARAAAGSGATAAGPAAPAAASAARPAEVAARADRVFGCVAGAAAAAGRLLLVLLAVDGAPLLGVACGSVSGGSGGRHSEAGRGSKGGVPSLIRVAASSTSPWASTRADWRSRGRGG